MLNATLKTQKGNRRSAICRMAFISPSHFAPTTTFPSHYDILLSFSRCSRSCLTRSSSRLYASTIRVTSLWRMISFCVISTKAMPSTPCNIRWASTRPLFATTASLSACGHPSRSFWYSSPYGSGTSLSVPRWCFAPRQVSPLHH